MEESYEEIQTKCSNCNISFKIQDMKVEPRSNKLVCINCYNNPDCKISKIR